MGEMKWPHGFVNKERHFSKKTLVKVYKHKSLAPGGVLVVSGAGAALVPCRAYDRLFIIAAFIWVIPVPLAKIAIVVLPVGAPALPEVGAVGGAGAAVFSDVFPITKAIVFFKPVTAIAFGVFPAISVYTLEVVATFLRDRGLHPNSRSESEESEIEFIHK